MPEAKERERESAQVAQIADVRQTTEIAARSTRTAAVGRAPTTSIGDGGR